MYKLLKWSKIAIKDKLHSVCTVQEGYNTTSIWSLRSQEILIKLSVSATIVMRMHNGDSYRLYQQKIPRQTFSRFLVILRSHDVEFHNFCGLHSITFSTILESDLWYVDVAISCHWRALFRTKPRCFQLVFHIFLHHHSYFIPSFVQDFR